MSDPTCFAPVIDYVRGMAENMQDGDNYVVLLIITDGGIADMDETKRMLVEHSNLPMSLIIVGVGSGDMKNMDILDDDARTLSYRGVKSKRDIVQFIGNNKLLFIYFYYAIFYFFVELSRYIPEPTGSQMFSNRL